MELQRWFTQTITEGQCCLCSSYFKSIKQLSSYSATLRTFSLSPSSQVTQLQHQLLGTLTLRQQLLPVRPGQRVRQPAAFCYQPTNCSLA